MEVRKNTVRKTMDSTTDHHHDHDNAAFWLPTHFLSDDDFLSAAGDSPVSSSQTEKDHELLAEFTRQLARSSLRDQPHHHNNSNPPHEKPWMFSTSPQSTLTGFGPWSPNGPSRVPSPSPPLTPPGAAKRDAAWELLYEAAGHVARLKMNAMAAQLNLHHHHQQQNRGLPRSSSSLSTNQYQQQLKRQGREREEWYCQHHQQSRASGGGALGLPQSAWPPVRGVAHHHHSHRQQSGGGPPGGSDMRAVFLAGRGSGSGHTAVPPVKRQSTGTGVFIPLSQRVGTTQPEPRKKPTGCSTVLLPARVVQALNLDLEEINNNGVNRNSHSRFGSAFLTDHEVLIARRNALLSQQRQSMKAEGVGATATMVGGGHDIGLPSDWTY